MTADTLKTTRVLELYQDFLSGKLINKQQAAEQYHVNVRSIQRDIDSIRDFLSEQCAKEGIVRKIEYDKKENGYRLVTQEIEQLSKGEVLALCKILLESRAFTKEQVEKQLQIILNLCVSQKEKSDIEWFIPGFQNPIELQPLRAKNGCASIGFLHDMGSRVFCLDVADLTVNALLCRRDAAIAIDVHASPFWLKDNERHF